MLLLHYRRLLSTYCDRRKARAAQSAAARALLGEIAESLGFANAPMEVTAHGRPYFKYLPTVDFSLAHTDTLAVCALWQKQEGEPPRIGIDAEKRPRYSDERLGALSTRFFGAEECRYVMSAQDRKAAFAEVFVRKEAYAKYCGDGLGAHLGKSDTLSPDFEAANGVRFFPLLVEDHFISLCLPQACQETPVHFSAAKTPQTGTQHHRE